MTITAKKLSNSLLDEKFRSKYEKLGIPQIREHNLYQILDLAKNYKVPWWYLMHIVFNLRNIHSKGFASHWGIGNQLELEFTTPHGIIEVGLVRDKLNQLEKSEHLLKIQESINKAHRK